MTEELDEIWSLYGDDGAQALDQAESALLALEHNPENQEAIACLFRAIHTFKGNSRLLGLSVVESRAHLAEDLIGLVRDEGVPLDAGMLSLLMEAVDVLRGMLEETVAARHDADEAAGADLAGRMRAKYKHCKDKTLEPEPAPASAAPAEKAPEPVELTTAAIFEPVEETGLGDDPVYQRIFLDMARDVINEMRAALAQFGETPDAARAAIAEAAERLQYAARQIGMMDWMAILPEFAAGPLTRDGAEALIVRLEALQGGGAEDAAPAAAKTAPESPESESPAAVESPQGECPAGESPVAAFFAVLDPMLAAFSALDPGDGNAEARAARAADISVEFQQIAAPLGFNKAIAIASEVPNACGQPEQLARVQFRFFEELVLIEQAAAAEHAYAQNRVGVMLRSWCAGRIFVNLLELGAAVEEIRQNESVAENCRHISEMLRQVHYACAHYGIGTAGQVAMALVDLFERVLAGESNADPVLMHVAKSFVSSLELVFSAVSAGQKPNLSGIGDLLREAESVAFVASGAVSASAIEARLGLPKNFHQVLTPESVKTAAVSLEAGHHFYIVHADLNDNAELADRFFNWLSAGGATVITNVTRFLEGRTAFDFLLASALGGAAFAEALTLLDPKGEELRLEMSLTDRKNTQPARREARESAPAEQPREVMSEGMLESIGEIVTGHALARHMLTSLGEEDPVQMLDAELRAAGGNWHAARENVRRRLREWQDRIEQLVQVEEQLAGRIGHLQEQAIAVRTRPASLLLKPLAVFGETLAREHGRQAAVTASGDDVELDVSMLETFKKPLHALVAFAVSSSIEPVAKRGELGKPECGHVHIALARHDGQIAVTIEDDGAGLDMAGVAERARERGWQEPPHAEMVLRENFGNIVSDGGSVNYAEIRHTLRLGGGDLQIGNSASGGLRLRATLPLAMVVLDGMVVRAGEVMYVVPINAIQLITHPAADAMMTVSADDGRHMLRLESGDIVPVQFLMGGTAGRNVSPAPVNGNAQKRLFVVAGNRQRRVALSIDELIGQQLVMIRPLQGYLSGIRGVTGCALLGSGGVGMVLDMGFVLNQEAIAH